MTTLAVLNQKFGIHNQLEFTENNEGFVIISITNAYATAQVSSYAGQVLSFKPNNQAEDLLFLSDQIVYQHGKALRGGIPICWPWFGDDTSGFDRPAHGFVRNQQWTVLASEQCVDGRTAITLGLRYSDESLAVWPYKFDLQLHVIVGESLEISLTTHNLDNKDITITQALHTYFTISDVDHTAIQGLDEYAYLDKLDNFNSKVQSGDIVVDKEVDRVYQYSPEQVLLIDKGLNRTIKISSSGSAATIVWNPWSTSVTKISDLAPLSYKQFVCVETANAARDVCTVAEGKSHTITAKYEVI